MCMDGSRTAQIPRVLMLFNDLDESVPREKPLSNQARIENSRNESIQHS